MKRKKMLAVFISLVMAVTAMPPLHVLGEAAFGESEVLTYGGEITYGAGTYEAAQQDAGTFNVLPAEAISVDIERARALAQRLFEDDPLTVTLGQPLGAVGFDEGFDFNSPETVGITVTFVTPPSVAQRLLFERDGAGARFAPGSFDSVALNAHDRFRQQLGGLAPVVPPGFSPAGPAPSGGIQQLGANHVLFNGVFLNVPANMVMQIAALDEVYAVTPSVTFFAPTPPGGFQQNAPQIQDMGSHFNLAMLELFNTDYIHNEMGITGYGITVAVLDTGIDYNHPRFAPYRCYVYYGGRVPGYNFVLPPDHPVGYDNRVMDFGGHGTHVSGTVIAAAPGINLRHYRVLGGGQEHDEYSGAAHVIIAGVEAAHFSSDVMNLSLGSNGNAIFDPTENAINLASRDGTVVVIAAGNEGEIGSFSMGSPGVESLAITVGAGTLGGVDELTWTPNTSDNIAEFSSLGPAHETFHIKPDIVAPGEYIVSAIPGSLIDPTAGPYDFADPDWPGWGFAYDAWPGTSMATPAMAGVAALMREQFPAAPPHEIKARLMNTATPLADIGAANSVFTVGAGRVRPMEALNSENFATVSVLVPQYPGNPGDPDVWDNDFEGEAWAYQPMASLSFGAVAGAAGGTATSTLPVTITGGGTWTASHSFNGSSEGVVLNIAAASDGTFDVTIEFDGVETRTMFEGNIIFTSGGNQITMPFAAMFVPQGFTYELMANSGATRPILAGAGVDFEYAANHPEEYGPLSYFSEMFFGFYDIENEIRTFDFFARPVSVNGLSNSGTVYYFNTVDVPANVRWFFEGGPPFLENGVVVRSFEAVRIDASGEEEEDVGLDEGVYELFAKCVCEDGCGPISLGKFVVTNTPPQLNFDKDVFIYDPESGTVKITGYVESLGHDLAIKYNVRTVTYAYAPVFGYRFAIAEIAVQGDGIYNVKIEPDGSFVLTVAPGGEWVGPIGIGGIATDGYAGIVRLRRRVGALRSAPSYAYFAREGEIPPEIGFFWDGELLLQGIIEDGVFVGGLEALVPAQGLVWLTQEFISFPYWVAPMPITGTGARFFIDGKMVTGVQMIYTAFGYIPGFFDPENYGILVDGFFSGYFEDTVWFRGINLEVPFASFLLFDDVHIDEPGWFAWLNDDPASDDIWVLRFWCFEAGDFAAGEFETVNFWYQHTHTFPVGHPYYPEWTDNRPILVYTFTADGILDLSIDPWPPQND